MKKLWVRFAGVVPDLRVWGLLFVFLMGASLTQAAQDTGHALTLLDATDPQIACAGCHAQAVTDWQSSHHALAMQPATPKTLLADVARWPGVPALKLSNIPYVFGISPLQQYLQKAPGGRLQVLPFAWDSQPTANGGQRWFQLQAGETYPPNDRLHWRQPLQNWNGMCADCHSTGLVRNYDSANNRFRTTARALNVSCAACHQLPDDHGTAKSAADKVAPAKAARRWIVQPGAVTAVLASSAATTTTQQTMETCAACHSLRTPLTDGFAAGAAFADHFSLSTLQPNLYHADGQIKEEAYVWGSFLQSKMFAQGVSCNDCHNPHNLALRVDGDALCGQCHVLEEFASPLHHGHPVASSGARCVNCHMPATTYMGVDARRDHKFVVPQPQLTTAYGVPNACTSCHAKNGPGPQASPAWAQRQIEKWHGGASTLPRNETHRLDSGSGVRLSRSTLAQVAFDTRLPAIARASVVNQQVQLWGAAGGALRPPTAMALMQTDELLLQVATLGALAGFTETARLAVAGPALTHERLAVRVAAADALLGDLLPARLQAAFATAKAELLHAQQQSAWRGEGRMNLARSAQRLSNWAEAEAQYQAAMEIDPYFAPAYVNLAELYRERNRADDETAVYLKALRMVADNATVQHGYALYLIRQQRLTDALKASATALELTPGNPRFALVHLLILDGLGRTREGLLWLQASWPTLPKDKSLTDAALSLSQKIQDANLYRWFSMQVVERGGS